MFAYLEKVYEVSKSIAYIIKYENWYNSKKIKLKINFYSVGKNKLVKFYIYWNFFPLQFANWRSR